MRNPSPLATPEALNQSWSVDFMHDALVCGHRFRTFNVVDDFNREALSIEIDLNLPAPRVVRVLDRIAANRGYPAMLRVDNGPSGFNRLNHGDDLVLSKTGFTHSDLLRWQIDYAGGSLKLNGTIMMNGYTIAQR